MAKWEEDAPPTTAEQEREKIVKWLRRAAKREGWSPILAAAAELIERGAHDHL